MAVLLAAGLVLTARAGQAAAPLERWPRAATASGRRDNCDRAGSECGLKARSLALRGEMLYT
jgi:hypothetical protein